MGDRASETFVLLMKLIAADELGALNENRPSIASAQTVKRNAILLTPDKLK